MKLLKIINLAHLFGVVWILSVFYFLVLLSLAFINNGLTEQQGGLIAIAIITGIIAFLGALLFYSIHFLFFRKKKRLGTTGSVRKGISPLFVIVPILILALAGVVAVYGAYNLGKAERLLQSEQTNPTETTNNTPDVTEEIRYIDSDPVITCTSSHPQCSGQSIQVRQSACSQIYCCRIDDKWSVYPSENDCKAAAQKEAPQQQNNTTNYPPCTINYSELGAITYYTIPPEECASKQIDQKVHEELRDSYDKCVQNFGAENCTNRSNP